MSTSAKVLNYLQSMPDLKLRQESDGQYRLNSPLRPGSDSFCFMLKIEGDEHGTYYDGVEGVGGSLYDLAEKLAIVPDHNGNGNGTKKPYSGLLDYAKSHNVPISAFITAGWREVKQTHYDNRPALSFPTKTGERFRFTDGEKPVFSPAKRGYKRCWYLLPEAIKIATETSQPLVISNGESSTIVGQYYKIASTAITSGEHSNIPDDLLNELKGLYGGPVVVVFDNDKAGNISAPQLAYQLKENGFDAKALKFSGKKGFDLCDFCGLYGDSSVEKLFELPEIENPQAVKNYLSSSADDDGNAFCVLSDYPSKFAYNKAFGWLSFNGIYWDDKKAEADINNCIVDTLKKRQRAAMEAQSMKIFNAAKCDMSRINAARNRMQALCQVDPEEFDANPNMLNTLSGVVNLQTGSIIPHNAKLQKYTYYIDCNYDPDCKNTIFIDWLLDAITPSGKDKGEYQSLLDWLQVAIGYTITGRTDEQCLFYIYGPTRSGKGLFSQTIAKLMGNPLAQSVGFETFTRKSTGNDQNFDLAPLKPARVIFASESGSGQRLNEAKTKRITGGDAIHCAHKGRSFFNYTPQFKIWLSSNFPIAGNSNDGAFWGRIRVIEFPNSHLGNENKILAKKLQSKESLAGLLTWAVEGSKKWYQMLSTGKGLITHEKVDALTINQRNENDSVGSWLTEFDMNGAMVSMAKISYQFFCEENDFKPVGNRQFIKIIEDLGYERKNSRTSDGQAKIWVKT